MNFKHIFLRIFAVCTLAFLAAAAVQAQGYTQHLIDMDDPIYDTLDREFRLGHIAFMPPVRPYTEKQVAQWLKEAAAHYAADLADEKKADLAKKRSTELEALLEQYKAPPPALLRTPEIPNLSAYANIPVVLETTALFNRLGDSVASLVPSLVIGINIGDSFHLSMDQEFALEAYAWEKDPYGLYDEPLLPDNVFNAYDLTAGTSTSNSYDYHVAGNFDVVYYGNTQTQMVFELEPARISLGRGVHSWGPGMWGQLSLSETAKPYEYVNLYIPIANVFSFSWITAMMKDLTVLNSEDTGAKLLNGHRIDFQPFDFLSFSLTETVVYSQRFELSYLNPLSLYYISEVRLGDFDNKMGGWDVNFRMDPVTAYWSMFIDDWWVDQMFSFNSFKNTFATLLGVEVSDLAPGFELGFEAAYLSHWMYTHRSDFAEDNGANNHNSYQHFSTPIGHPLDPNSLALRLQASWDMDEKVRMNADVMVAWHGMGPDEYQYTIDNWYDFSKIAAYYGASSEGEIFYPFLDYGLFDIRTTLSAAVGLDVALVPRKLDYWAKAGLEITDDGNGESDSLSVDVGVSMGLKLKDWSFWQ